MNELIRLREAYRKRAQRTRARALDHANPQLLEIAKIYDGNARQIEALIAQGENMGWPKFTGMDNEEVNVKPNEICAVVKYRPGRYMSGSKLYLNSGETIRVKELVDVIDTPNA